MTNADEWIKEFLIEHQFIFNPQSNTWKNKDLEIPDQIAKDMLMMGDQDKLLWLVDNGFSLKLINDTLIITNGVIVNNMQDFVMDNLSEHIKKHSKAMSKIIN